MCDRGILKIKEVIKYLDNKVPKPSSGLPEELFLYVSRITPLINVDLLIKDEKGRTLLAWRDDEYCGKGWHVPGGIVRFREKMEERVKKVAQIEIGSQIKINPRPIAFNQLIHRERKVRSHFISFLFLCSLPKKYVLKNKGLVAGEAGYLKWHEKYPDNMIKWHKIYKNQIDNKSFGGKS
ncbi:MAG: hypothetical protein A2231_04435 [Candidatus Firestonebacteria bacterium RIFOXYA2_FULL_40_8]|nr:MAG: hypothetical protein A2231_04435 [Candidatus Firestonebacteria bacterium RIFOXYA2_FULL_40_8]